MESTTVKTGFSFFLLIGYLHLVIAQSPTLFLEDLLSKQVEYSATLTPDQKTVYFVKTDSFYVSKPKTIYKTTQVNGQWSQPEKASFSDGFSDSSPFVSPDGKRLFFTSKRPVNGNPVQHNNIWYVDIENGEEGQAIFLQGINSDKSDYSPSVDKYGNLYFGSTRTGGEGAGDLWYSAFKDGKYQAPQNLGKNINSPYGEWGSCIAPNGQFIIFENSGKPKNQSAAGDLYIAFKENGQWQGPIHFQVPLNSVGSDLTPKIHGDQCYFASNRPLNSFANWNNVDLYKIPITEVLKSIQVPTKIGFVVRDYFKQQNQTSAGVAWIYFNKDTYPDLFISNAQKQNNTLYINQKGKGFVKKEIDQLTNDQSSTSAAAWADFDNDGDQDVLLTNQHGEDNRLYLNVEGTFQLHQSFEQGDSYHSNWVDFNNDGQLDCFISNAQTGRSQLFQQKDGQFIPIKNTISELEGFHSGASWLDINNDNFQDLYLTLAGASDEFFKNNQALDNYVSDRTILGNTVQLKNFTSGVSFGDYDNDGDLDAFVSNLNNQQNNFLKNSNGVFQIDNNDLRVDELSSWVGLWGDFDNDEDLDIIVTNYDQPNSIFENKGGYFFKVPIPKVTEQAFLSSGLAWADYNQDGTLDIAIANWEDRENLFLEGIPNGNNWLIFRLIGKESNKDAIGAKVTIQYGNQKVQYREIQSNMGLRSYPQRIAHFGLGQYAGEVKVSVVWPSGVKQAFKITDLNSYYEILEGDKNLKSY